MSLPAITSRTREKPLGNEEASTILSLGEFTGVPSLTLSEARMVINVVMNGRRDKAQGGAIRETEILVKTQDYLDVFSRFKQKENIEAVERLLSSRTELEPFERSQLGSLCPESADEAKTLIPSLAQKISDAELDELLREMISLRNFVE